MVEDTKAQLDAEVRRAAAEGARNVVLARIYFGFDRSDLNDSARATLDSKVPVLQANPDMRIRIAGHADPRGSDEYNLALGNRRAAAAKRYLENKGIDGSRIDVVSYGEERPLNPGHDEAATVDASDADSVEQMGFLLELPAGSCVCGIGSSCFDWDRSGS